MDEKTLNVLEYPKVLGRLAGYAAFSASEALARALRPTSDLAEAQRRLACTREARRLLSLHSDLRVGGVQDVRPQVDLAARGGTLLAADLLIVKNTLISARGLATFFLPQPQPTNRKEPVPQQVSEYPNLALMAAALFPPPGLIHVISKCLSDSGDILDQASDSLGKIRTELRQAHQRLLARLERMINDPHVSPMLQEPIITQRNGRYVVPLRADFKGRLRAMIHDQSSSGATLFVEPLAVVEMNNRWHELQLAERDEERRILTDLSHQVGQNAAQINAIVSSLADLDLALMCASYADDLHATEPVLLPYQALRAEHPGCTIHLYQARHPLLDQTKAVPLDIDLDDQTFALVITGPNTGGKTVTLKTMGLHVLMAQSGLHIPAQSGSALSLFEEVYADIGDEQSIEQSLSTFSGHIQNIIRIMNQARPTTLVLLDELGSGTDPQEGAALARAILAHMVERRIPCLVATHYPELKAFAHAVAGAINASMEFNLKTLRPTYHLTIGLPGRSNALLIAERLGLSTEIIQAARAVLDPHDLRAEDLLDEIHRQRDLARRARSDADRARTEAQKMRSELAVRLENLEDERIAVLEKARQQSQADVEQMQEEIGQLRRQMTRSHQPPQDLKPIQEELDALETAVEKPLEARRVVKKTQSKRPLQVGDRVQLRKLKTYGILISLGDDEVEVQLGALRMRVQRSDISRGVEEEEDQPSATPVPEPARMHKVAAELYRPSPGMELDLRGERAEDALERLDRYIDEAYLAGLPYVRVIHGKGSGRLRLVIRQALRQSVHVSSWTTGNESEGGDGVTVARLAVD